MPRRTTAVLALVLAGCTGSDPALGPEGPAPAPRAGDARPAIVSGPQNLGLWGPDVTFAWAADPQAASYEWALAHTDEYLADTGAGSVVLSEFVAWLEAAVVHPGTSDPMWIGTGDLAVTVEDVAPTDPDDLWGFGVRSVEAGGARAPLAIPTNARAFRVTDSLPGPVLRLVTNHGNCRRAEGEPPAPAPLIAPALRLEWATSPGVSGSPVAMTEWTIDGDPVWTPAGPAGAYPEDPGERWTPGPGPHVFSVRATDEQGFDTTLDFELEVLPARGQGVLVVQDTDPSALEIDGIVPPGFEAVELAYIHGWFAGRDYRVHSTGGTEWPTAAELQVASAVVWIHGTDVANGDASALQSAFTDPDGAERALLSSWRAAGGNLLLCGIQPVNALRYFQSRQCQVTWMATPVVFTLTETDPDLVAHFALEGLDTGAVGTTVGNTNVGDPALRLTEATAALPGWPDLTFDPLRWPNGPVVGGFGYHDRDLVPTADGVVAWTADATGLAVAIADLNGPGRRGSSLYLGLHPYFLQQSDSEALFDRVLDEFGVLRRETGPAPEADR